MADEFVLHIDEAGDVQYVYDDALAEVFDGEGDVAVRRASHVEPRASGRGWFADMRPVGGPVLVKSHGYVFGWFWMEAFPTRAEALAAERAWLDAYMTDGRL